MSERWPHCPHYDLGPPDEHGQRVCSQCGGVIHQSLPDYLSRPVPKIREGADVVPIPLEEWR